MGLRTKKPASGFPECRPCAGSRSNAAGVSAANRRQRFSAECRRRRFNDARSVGAALLRVYISRSQFALPLPRALRLDSHGAHQRRLKYSRLRTAEGSTPRGSDAACASSPSGSCAPDGCRARDARRGRASRFRRKHRACRDGRAKSCPTSSRPRAPSL